MASVFQITFIVIGIALLQVQGKNLESGRRLYNNSSKVPPQTGQQRYATKEIILYLTPSQIRALQEGKGLIGPPQVPQPEKHTHAYANSQQQERQNNEFPRPHLAQPEPLKPPSFQRPSDSDRFIPIIPPHEYRQPASSVYNNVDLENHQRRPQSTPFFPETNKDAVINQPKALPALIPHEPQTGKENDNQISRDQLKEQWQQLLDQNRAHFKAVSALSQYESQKANENKKDFHYISQQEQNLNDQRYASDVYSLVRANNQHQLEKQALLQAIENSPPLLVHKEININHIPAHLITHIPVPTPILFPFPEPFEVRVPQPYAIPLELIKQLPVPVQVINTHNIEAHRPVPTELEKHIPFPVTKNGYVDRPFIAERVVPFEVPSPIPGGLPTHHHEWHH